MFPARYLRSRMTLNAASLRGEDGVRDAAGMDVAAAARSAKAQASGPGRAPAAAARGRAVGALRRIVPMVMAACVLAGPAATAAGDAHPAQNLVMQVSSRVIESLESERETLRAHPERLYDLVNRIVLPYFNFERMSRRVLGKRWKKVTEAQQERFVAAFRTLLVRTYALVLNEYGGQKIEYLDPVARKRDDEIIIPVKVTLSASESVVVAYAMQGSGTDWKVFDVAIDGVSLVTNYRSSFRSEIARHGIDGLTARIEAKNARTH